MFNNNSSIGKELLNAPMGEMIYQMASAIAEGQMALDENSIEVAEMMGGLKTVTADIDGKEVVTFEDSRVFFGKEKLSIANAVVLYNTSKDLAYRSQIFNPDATPKINNNLYEYVTPIPPEDIDKKIKLKDPLPPNTVTEIYAPSRSSLLELGFTPTFYQFVDTVIELKLSMSMTSERSSNVEVKTNSKTRSASLEFKRGRIRARRNVTTTQVNASYAQKYSYSAEGSSLMRTKLVPIPPPAILEQRIQEQMDIAREQAANN
ncbi:hypothetical protein [uncultured Dokdonia sp.]|uniref:hypothetical protein n=1 Tax=uncultured Dokdonia sp. TaxID=575653 RepID=UPI00261A0C48|nr:hypothetical protein [uncultured Dokdonia sp.]